MDRERPRRFITTHWSLVDRAGQACGDDRRAALNSLLQSYHEPMCRFLMDRFGHPREVADDLVQGFLMTNVLEKDLLRNADRDKGKFRTFLLIALKRYAANEWRSAMTQRRGGGKVVAVGELPELAEGEMQDAFDIAWARQVLQEAIGQMEDECRQSDRLDVWGVFDARVLAPLVRGEPPPAYGAMVEGLEIASATQASNLLVTGKRMFVRSLRAVIGEYAKTSKDIDAEILDLQQILSRGGARS